MAENHHNGPTQPQSASGTTQVRRWCMPTLLLVLTILFSWRLTLTNQFSWTDSPDFAFQVLPWFQVQVREIQQGRLPLWDPYQFGGQSLIGQAQPGTAYPLNWLLFSLPTSNGLIRQGFLNWYYVLIHFMGVAFAYWLCRDRNLSLPASVLGGVLYGLGGYMGHIDWPQMLNGAVWGPLIVMFLLRIREGRRVWVNATRGGFCLGMAFLSGHHQVPIYFTLMSAFIWLWLILRTRRIDWQGIRLAALFFTMTLLAGALQILPAWEYSQGAVRWIGHPQPVGHDDRVPYDIHDRYSLRPQSLLGLVVFSFTHDDILYSGATATALALLGVALGWRNGGAPFASALAAGGLVLTLGAGTMIHGVLYTLIPLVEKARSPNMAAVIFHLGFTLLAASALDLIPSNWGSIWISRIQRAAAVLILLVLLAALNYGLFMKGEWRGDTRFILNAVILAAAAVLLHAWRSGLLSRGLVMVLLIVCVFIELGNGKVSYLRNYIAGYQFLPRLAEGKQLLEAIRRLPDKDARLWYHFEDSAYSFGDYNGIEAWNGYVASLPKDTFGMGLFDARTMELFSVRYRLAREASGGWSYPVEKVSEDLKIFENRSALPRVWTVHAAKTAGSFAEVQDWLGKSETDPRTEAMVFQSQVNLSPCAGVDDSRLQHHVSDRVRVWVRMECRGLLIVADSFAPGWTATADGKSLEILQVNGNLRGVVLETGTHAVEMRYRPWSVYKGFGMTVVACLAAFWVRRIDKTVSS